MGQGGKLPKKIMKDVSQSQTESDTSRVEFFKQKIKIRLGSGGNRARRRPQETWRISVEREMKALGWSWDQVTKLAADTKHWCSLFAALCLITHEDDYVR